MTYCVALRLNRGLVFAADTRTNAGVDNIAQFRKIHYWRKPGERVLVLLTAGNLSLTQSVVSLLNEQLVEREEEPDAVNLYNVPSMYRAARLVGDAVRSIRAIDGRGARSDARPDFPAPSFSAARSARSRRACSRSTPRATSSRRPTRRRFSRSASTSTASRSSTAWRSRPCGSAKRRS